MSHLLIPTMELLVVFRHLIFVSYIVEIITCLSHDNCHRQTFYKIQNKTYADSVLVGEGPWPLLKCRSNTDENSDDDNNDNNNNNNDRNTDTDDNNNKTGDNKN
ncbi:hypothetical protein LSH36_1679g00012 [Paralvinella palmiformis]|uniref:Uncharacterized protein n=1 Tax=Paralvinella palmiformis TaxID=53620 RepID=A0AAD9MM79_9ANNE|nr:hypothetical protein LSH36_1679g00012 [Paralvinella palmiformis]